MKKLKITAPQWEKYTGSIGIVHFTNGVSDGLVPENVRRRLSIGMQMIEIDAEGNEENVSATHRLLNMATIRATVSEPLARQTDAEKAQESLDNALVAGKQPTFYTKEELEKIADKQGIKGVREVAKLWDVRHRSIPTLINMILDAQERFLAKRKNQVVERIEQELVASEALRQAAVTGDMSAAINAANSETATDEDNSVEEIEEHHEDESSQVEQVEVPAAEPVGMSE